MSLLTRIGGRVGDLLAGPDDRALSQFRREMDQAIDRAWKAFQRDPWVDQSDVVAWPAIDVNEDEKAVTLKVDVPGMEAKDVEVEVSGDLLTIKGSRKEEKEEKNGGRYRHERFAGSFARSVTLPPYVDAGKIEARYDMGVLTISAPKVPGKAPETKQVPVKSA